MHFENHTVIVTGGGSGIGRATSLIFAQKGAKVMVADINEEQGQKTVALIKEQGGTATFQKTDVSKVEEVEALVEACVKTYGRLDHMINNAGIYQSPVFFDQISDEEWHRIMAINQSGVFFGMRAALRIMKAQQKGSIVNTASVAGLLSAPQAAAYAASKFAVVGMTKTAAVEYAKYGIRINAICPGVIETPMADTMLHDNEAFKAQIQKSIPMKRFGKAEEIARSICWISSEEASYMNGASLRIDGAFQP
ncbi:MAG: glucose 1-dehydrogenase [Bacteroidota bacterium]